MNLHPSPSSSEIVSFVLGILPLFWMGHAYLRVSLMLQFRSLSFAKTHLSDSTFPSFVVLSEQQYTSSLRAGVLVIHPFPLIRFIDLRWPFIGLCIYCIYFNHDRPPIRNDVSHTQYPSVLLDNAPPTSTLSHDLICHHLQTMGKTFRPSAFL